MLFKIYQDLTEIFVGKVHATILRATIKVCTILESWFTLSILKVVPKFASVIYAFKGKKIKDSNKSKYFDYFEYLNNFWVGMVLYKNGSISGTILATIKFRTILESWSLARQNESLKRKIHEELTKI